MKTLLSALAVATLFGMAQPPARGQDAISVDFFYDNLSPHGDWLDVGDYGYVWQPHDTRDDWRPYSDGRWVYTDAGWTWDSVEPYGWAVYHYGRWANMRDVGWVWVPGTEWGPAWVSWRRSPEYVGWAPLPPEARFSRSIGFSSWVDDHYDIGPGSYRFVEGRNFGARRLNTVFVDQRQNVTIINQTTNITNITYRDNVVYNGGPDYDERMRRSSEPISRYRLDRRRDFDGKAGRAEEGYFQSRVEGDSYSVASPRLREGGGGKPAKLSRTVDDAEVDRGWRDLGNPDEVAQVRAKMKSDTPAPADLPKRADIANRPGRAVAEEKGGKADRPGDAGNQNKSKGEGEGKAKGNKGNNETGMRNRQPEPGAPRPNREAPGKGVTEKGAPGKSANEKGDGRPSPGNQAKGKEKENEAKPGNAPRPNRMPVEAAAPGKGGERGSGGKGNAEKETRPATPTAGEKGRSGGEPGRKQEEGRPSPNREGGEKGTRPDRAAPAAPTRPAPNTNRKPGEDRKPEGRPSRTGPDNGDAERPGEAGGNRAPGSPSRDAETGKGNPSRERAREIETDKRKEEEKGRSGN